MQNRVLAEVLASVRESLSGCASLRERVAEATGLPLTVAGWDAGEVAPPVLIVLASRAAFSRGSGDTAIILAEATLPVFGARGEPLALAVAQDVVTALYSTSERVRTVDLVEIGPGEDGNWTVAIEAAVQF